MHAHFYYEVVTSIIYGLKSKLRYSFNKACQASQIKAQMDIIWFNKAALKVSEQKW